jgi:thiol-disulfide isomerase/thioredoxin
MAADGGSEQGERPSAPARYSLVVGVAFIAVIVVATLNTLRTDSGGILGTDNGELRGKRLPEFAVPTIPGPDADANVTQDDCAVAEDPCPPDEQRTTACQITAAHAIRICDLFDKPLVISFWFTNPGGCPATQDSVNAVAQRFRGRVNFLSIAIRGDAGEIQEIAREQGWTIRLGWDRDGAVANLYRVGVCPTVAFAFPGGTFAGAEIGEGRVRRPALTASVRRLIERSRRRGRTGDG